MKHIKTDNTGGMPLKQYTLAKLQESYFELFFSMLSFLGINSTVGKYIISGCEIIGSDITAGWMFIDGDLVYFAGSIGDANTKFKKGITAETAAFKNGENKPLYFTSFVNIDSSGTLITDFIRVNPLITLPEGIVIDPADLTAIPPQLTVLERIELLEAMVAPIKAGNSPILYNGAANTVPDGYAEWIPMRGLLPIGYDPNNVELDAVGNNVGENEHTITQGELPIQLNTWKPYEVGGTTNDFLSWKTTGVITPIKLLPASKVVMYIIWIGL